MRVSIEVGDGSDLCYLLEREIRSKRVSREILAAMPAHQSTSNGTCSYGESVTWCEQDIAIYTLIRDSLAQALRERAADDGAVDRVAGS